MCSCHICPVPLGRLSYLSSPPSHLSVCVCGFGAKIHQHAKTSNEDLQFSILASQNAAFFLGQWALCQKGFTSET